MQSIQSGGRLTPAAITSAVGNRSLCGRRVVICVQSGALEPLAAPLRRSGKALISRLFWTHCQATRTSFDCCGSCLGRISEDTRMRWTGSRGIACDYMSRSSPRSRLPSRLETACSRWARASCGTSTFGSLTRLRTKEQALASTSSQIS